MPVRSPKSNCQGMKRFCTYTAKLLLNAVLIAFQALILQSCGSIFDDLEPCPGGVAMRFVYDYNTESANAFANQVDCLTLHIYDADGAFVKTVTPPRENLSDEDWRLQLDLPAGIYHAVAYGGITCDNACFAHVPEPSAGSHFTDISMQLIASKTGQRLHDHFHGAVDFSINADAETMTEVRMPMTKTTNHFRILLRQLDGQPLDGNDFDFYIIDDNKELDHANIPVRSGQDIIYTANLRGKAEEMAFGELSTSRLHLSNSPRFIIASKDLERNRDTRADVSIDEDRIIVDMPLLPYLVLSKSDAVSWSNQEYLDRCSQWNMTFFLDENREWLSTKIIINGWTVRINDLDN